MRILILISLIQLIPLVVGDNYINLTIYNNLNYSIVLTDFKHLGVCSNCTELMVDSCKTANVHAKAWFIFLDVYIKFKIYRYHHNKPNDANNLILKDSLRSNFDLIPHTQGCIDEITKIKKSLIVQTNSEEDGRSNICGERFIDISDQVEKSNCKFNDFDNFFR